MKTANFPTRDPSNPRVARGEIPDLSQPARNAHECALAAVFARSVREPFECSSAEIPRLRSAKKHSMKNAGPEGTRLARDWSGRRMCCAELQSLVCFGETAVCSNSTPQQFLQSGHDIFR